MSFAIALRGCFPSSCAVTVIDLYAFSDICFTPSSSRSHLNNCTNSSGFSKPPWPVWAFEYGYSHDCFHSGEKKGFPSLKKKNVAAWNDCWQRVNDSVVWKGDKRKDHISLKVTLYGNQTLTQAFRYARSDILHRDLMRSSLQIHFNRYNHIHWAQVSQAQHRWHQWTECCESANVVSADGVEDKPTALSIINLVLK